MDPGLLHLRAGALDWELLGLDGCINIPSPGLIPHADSLTRSPQSPRGEQPASWASGWGAMREGEGGLEPLAWASAWPGAEWGKDLLC